MNGDPFNQELVRIVPATPAEVAAFLEASERTGKGPARRARRVLADCLNE
jgi:hypothetical protein